LIDIVEFFEGVAEGVEGLVPYKGSVHNIMQDVLGAIRASMGYAGLTSSPP